MTLTEEELNSPLWHKLTQHWEERLQRLREDNDKELDELKTAKLRGKIAAVKDDIALGKPRKVVEVE